MRTNCLRLRLVVQRHALPEVRIVFAIELDTGPTIANLLEQINEIIPLESNDWGLEDYIVELRGSDGHAFECLHFQPVSGILKDDEEVFIRPLVTEDRQKRRLSGRHQISTNGKHLIDGIAFGRPRLKTPRDRPLIDIPPLKRRRLAYRAEESEDEDSRLLLTERGGGHQEDGLVWLRPRSDDADDDDFEGDEEYVDGDFADDTDGEDDENDDMDSDDAADSELEDELRDLQAENGHLQDDPSEEIANKESQAPTQAKSKQLDLLRLDRITMLRAAFPNAPVDVCEKAVVLHNDKLDKAYDMLRFHYGYRPAKALGTMLASSDTLQSEAPAAVVDDGAGDSEAESVTSIVKHYDQHGFPSGSILAGTASAQMAEVLRKSGHLVKRPVHTKFDESLKDTRDGGHRELIENAGTSSSQRRLRNNSHARPPSSLIEGISASNGEDESGNDSESGSDSGPEIASSKTLKVPAGARLPIGDQSSPKSDSDSESESDGGGGDSSDDSSDDSSVSSEDVIDSGSDSDSDSYSDSDSDSDNSSGGDSGEVRGGPDNSAIASENEESGSSSEDSSDDSSSDSSSPHPASKEATATHASGVPGPKSQETSPRSLERSVAQLDCEIGSPQTISAQRDATRPIPPGQGKTATQRRNARRRAALKARKAALEGESSLTPISQSVAEPGRETRDSRNSIAAKKAELLRSLGAAANDMALHTSAPLEHESVPAAAWFFGALGLKNPTSKDDEEQLRSTLMKNIQPLVNHRLVDSTDDQCDRSNNEPTGQEDPEAWRDRIVYRGVECCHDGVELSEPPFPFVQRWDPQQQHCYKDKTQRGGRSKRKQRNQAEFLDGEARPNTKRRKFDGDPFHCDADDDACGPYRHQDRGFGYDETVLNYDDEPQETPKQMDHSPRKNVEEEDLPPLPTDVSTLPMLRPGDAAPGMVLTWKQWLLSKATSWQPQVSSLTGLVVDVLEKSSLRVRLAKRDRNLDQNEKVYDDEGNRVYDKFELPGVDDEDEEAAEEGYRTLEFADMIEPRVLRTSSRIAESIPSVQQAPSTLNDDEATCAAQELAHQVEPERHQADSQQIGIDRQQSIVSGAALSESSPCLAGQLPSDGAVSVSEDRRREISLLINNAGFRKDVDPSVTKTSSLNLSSPSRQLEEMAHELPGPALEVSPAPSHVSRAGPDPCSQAASNNVDSQPILLEPFNGFSDAIKGPVDAGQASYPKLDLPTSDMGSIHSGRQVDPDLSIELSNSPFNEFSDGEGKGGTSSPAMQHESGNDVTLATLEGLKPRGRSPSESSDDSFPSLSQVWISASTNGSRSPTRGAVSSAAKARKLDIRPDLEYEEAMRRLDDGDELSGDDDEGQQPQLSKLAQKLVDKPIEKPSSKKLIPRQKKGSAQVPATRIKTERASPSPSTHDSLDLPDANRPVRSNGSPFRVPEGSQVVSLLTSSPEPEVEENYAEDSIDETYKEPDMPEGRGWVKKSRERRGVRTTSRAVREASPKRSVSSQSKHTTSTRSSAALTSLLRAKKRF
ncbi:hypothetical protein MMYC01_209691 [Madurella mycetomatis]|uniref:DUF7357 domain-containing protein n=1 Tax=Madurella mycetomatis TaxID=100816 RepID=A0A175VSD7_9PEZI|nr:hypothetical protein MMYC01_209691 [Madurella mycetomatis]